MKKNIFLVFALLSFIFACNYPIDNDTGLSQEKMRAEIARMKDENTLREDENLKRKLEFEKSIELKLQKRNRDIQENNRKKEKALKELEDRYVEENLPVNSIENLKNEVENFVLEVSDFIKSETLEIKPIWIKAAAELMKDINAYQTKGNYAEAGELKSNLLPAYEKLKKLYDDTVVELDHQLKVKKWEERKIVNFQKLH